MERALVNLEIHNPELALRMEAHVRTGRFNDTEDLIEKALDALDQSGAEQIRPDDVRAGLLRHTTVFQEGLGMFGSAADAALLDEVVSMAYAERRRPSRPLNL